MRWRSHRISSNLNPRRWFANFWGAHAARVLVSASRRNSLLLRAIPVPLGAHDKSSRSRGRAHQHASRVRSPDNRSPFAFRSIWGTKSLWGTVGRTRNDEARMTNDDNCRPFDSLAPAHLASGLLVYVARSPPAPFCETPWRLTQTPYKFVICA